MMVEGKWLPLIDKEICTGCGDCVSACPTDVLALVDNTAVVFEPTACNYCAACEAICPVAAVALPYQLVLASGRPCHNLIEPAAGQQ